MQPLAPLVCDGATLLITEGEKPRANATPSTGAALVRTRTRARMQAVHANRPHACSIRKAANCELRTAQSAAAAAAAAAQWTFRSSLCWGNMYSGGEEDVGCFFSAFLSGEEAAFLHFVSIDEEDPPFPRCAVTCRAVLIQAHRFALFALVAFATKAEFAFVWWDGTMQGRLFVNDLGLIVQRVRRAVVWDIASCKHGHFLAIVFTAAHGADADPQPPHLYSVSQRSSRPLTHAHNPVSRRCRASMRREVCIHVCSATFENERAQCS